MAVAASERDWEMIDVLLGFGARVPTLTKWGKSYYLKHLDVARYLLERGMDPNQTNWHGTSLLHDVAWCWSNTGPMFMPCRRLSDSRPEPDAWRSWSGFLDRRRSHASCAPAAGMGYAARSRCRARGVVQG